jgi:hypothetical protein
MNDIMSLEIFDSWTDLLDNSPNLSLEKWTVFFDLFAQIASDATFIENI